MSPVLIKENTLACPQEPGGGGRITCNRGHVIMAAISPPEVFHLPEM